MATLEATLVLTQRKKLNLDPIIRFPEKVLTKAYQKLESYAECLIQSYVGINPETFALQIQSVVYTLG